MHKLLSWLAILLLLVNGSFCQAESSEDFFFYSIGLGVEAASGKRLPTPVVSVEEICLGLHISIYNDCNVDNYVSVMLVCNGQLVSYAMDDAQNASEVQTFWSIPAHQGVDLYVYPDMYDIERTEVGNSILHIVVIGLCDRYPVDEYDDIQGFSTVVSIPVEGFGDEGIKNTFFQPDATASIPVSSNDETNLVSGIKFLSVAGEDRFTIQFATTAEEQELEYFVYSQYSDVLICCFVDNQLYEVDGRDGVWLRSESDKGYKGAITLNMQPGIHQVYMMCIPMFETSPCFVTSEKIVVEVL